MESGVFGTESGGGRIVEQKMRGVESRQEHAGSQGTLWGIQRDGEPSKVFGHGCHLIGQNLTASLGTDSGGVRAVRGTPEGRCLLQNPGNAG